MGVLRLALLFVSSLAASASSDAAAATDNADCIGLGFTGLNRCSDCDVLQVGLHSLPVSDGYVDHAGCHQLASSTIMPYLRYYGRTHSRVSDRLPGPTGRNLLVFDCKIT